MQLAQGVARSRCAIWVEPPGWIRALEGPLCRGQGGKVHSCSWEAYLGPMSGEQVPSLAKAVGPEGQLSQGGFPQGTRDRTQPGCQGRARWSCLAGAEHDQWWPMPHVAAPGDRWQAATVDSFGGAQPLWSC